MTRRVWLLSFLLILAVLILAGCTGGGGPPVVDNAIAWISGLVTKSRGEPVQSATVTLTETSQSTTTESPGPARPDSLPRAGQHRGHGADLVHQLRLSDQPPALLRQPGPADLVTLAFPP